MPERKSKVYSQIELIEKDKEFSEELRQVHNSIQNIFNNYTNKKDIKLELVKLLINVYDRKKQKDINIEAFNVQIKNASN